MGAAATQYGVGVVAGVADVAQAAVEVASPTAGWTGEVRTFPTVPVMGTEALISYRLDDGEHERRKNAGAKAITSAEVLELLLNLPVDMPVPEAALTRRERAAVTMARHGMVTVHDGRVTHLAAPPVTVELALISARRWQDGLGRGSSARRSALVRWCYGDVRLIWPPCGWRQGSMEWV